MYWHLNFFQLIQAPNTQPKHKERSEPNNSAEFLKKQARADQREAQGKLWLVSSMLYFCFIGLTSMGL